MERENTSSQSGWLSSGKREKLASVLRTANEWRQNYYPSRGSPDPRGSRWGEENAYEAASSEELMEYVSNGKEEITVFPTWGRKGLDRIKRSDENNKPHDASAGRAVVEVNVRGWVYTPHTAFPPTRKNRFATAMVGKLCGLPPLPTTSLATEQNQDAYVAGDGVPIRSKSTEDLRERKNAMNDPAGGASSRLAWITSKYGPQPIQRPSPPVSSPGIEEAHNALRTRLAPFLASSCFNMPLTVFFYNAKTAQSVSLKTDSLGHFVVRKSLEFEPTHIRVLAGETLCAEDKISFIDAASGISLISDIDDTIKVSGIGSGLREMFRNLFTREIPTMPVPGVAGWFSELAKPPYGVQIHYLSNSPWQLFTFLKELVVGHMKLPLGTWHLKKYSGFVQGIFEPVIERKKESFEMLLNSFPGRRWILVGDGGEGDLEVYTDVVRRWPGKVIAVYIRDVSGIGEEVVGAQSDAYQDPQNEKNFFDGNTTGTDMKSLNFGQRDMDLLQKEKNLPPLPASMKDQSLNRQTTDLPRNLQIIEFEPEIKPLNRTSTWSGSPTSATESLPNSTKSGPPPVPSKPRGLRGIPLPQSLTGMTEKKGYVTQVTEAGKSGDCQSVPTASDPTVALYDGRAYGPPSPPPPPLPRRRSNVAPNPPPPYGYSNGESVMHTPLAQQSTASLPASLTSVAQQNPTIALQRPLDKKAELWKKRWEYASQILAEQGVVLRSWKVGQDVHKDSVELVKSIVNDDSLKKTHW